MRPRDEHRIRELLQRLECLDSRNPGPEEVAIIAVARNAIVDEMTRVLRQDWLAVYRKGGTLDAISLAF